MVSKGQTPTEDDRKNINGILFIRKECVQNVSASRLASGKCFNVVKAKNCLAGGGPKRLFSEGSFKIFDVAL